MSQVDIQNLIKSIIEKVHFRTPEETQFIATIKRVAKEPLAYENESLIDYALTHIIPLERLYSKAAKDAKEDDSYGEQDYVVRELVKWFKHDFFTWVNAPKCDECGGESEARGMVQPTEEEKYFGAGRVEYYQCKSCSSFIRFPRYNSIRKLLDTRKGRCGEFAQVFTFLCRAVGNRARYIWNAEDHVWTEVYSEKQKRWIHLDSCEAAFDEPLIYQDGWGKKMSYCFGASVEGIRDVTKRYVTKPESALPRNKINENLLSRTLKELTDERRVVFGVDEIKKLEAEDLQEDKQLSSRRTNETRTQPLGPRESGAGEWTSERGEDGSGVN